MKKKPAAQVPPATPPRPADTALEALAWAVSNGASDKLVSEVRRKSRTRRRRQITAAAAGIAAILLVVTLLWYAPAPAEIPVSATPPSAVVSAPASQRLPDGSLVELKDGATIAVAFTQSARRVTLEHGEAHFQVAKNPHRPFIVTANGITVRAVGTAFSVQTSGESVDVLVTEGRVAVNPVANAPAGAAASTASADVPAAPADGHHADIIVEAGRRVVVNVATQAGPPPRVIDVTTDERKARLSWRVPRLEFSGTPLNEAIPMFNRHGGAHFVLDPSLGKLQLSGTLRADDTDSLLLLLKDEFGIRAETRDDGAVALLPQ